MQNKRVLLLNVNYTHHSLTPIASLGYLSAFLKKNGHAVRIFDGNKLRAGTEDYLKAVLEFKPDLIGFTVMCTGFPRLKEILQHFRESGEHLPPIIVGGPMISAEPLKHTRHLAVKFGCFGEGELTLLELVENIDRPEAWSGINGLVYQDESGNYSQNAPRELIKDLDSLPFPDYAEMRILEFNHTPITYPVKKLPYISIYTTRGCPCPCTFCATQVTWGTSIRFRDPVKCVDEIEYLIKNFGIKEIFVGDDNFTCKKSHALKFCDELLRRNIKIPWQCPNGVRIDTLDEELLARMKEAGCHAFGLGIESGNDEILKLIRKQLTTAQISEKLKIIKKAGILVQGFFIIGFPDETEDQIADTLRFALDQPFDRLTAGVLSPYPGSRIYKEYFSDAPTEELDWEAMDLLHTQQHMNTLDNDRLYELIKQFYWKFYLRPRVLLNMFPYLIKPRVIKSILSTRLIKSILR